VGIACILPFYQFRRFYQQFDAAAFREIQDDPIKALSIHAPEENSRRTLRKRQDSNGTRASFAEWLLSHCIGW